MSSFRGTRITVASVALSLCSVILLVGCGSEEAPVEPEEEPTDVVVGLPFAESFEDGTEDADITPDNSIFNVVENEPATFENSPDPIDGSFVGHYESSGDNIRTKVEFTDSDGVSEIYERVYLWVDSYPSAVMRFLTFETSPSVTPPGEDVLALRMDSDGYLEVYDGTEFAPADATEDPLPLGEWVRLEVGYDATVGEHGQSTLQVFTGLNLNGTEPDNSVTVDHTASPTHPVTTAAFGVLNFVDVQFSLDAIEASTDDWVGPADTG